MAMTTAQQTDMYQFFIVAFGAAPGVEYMNQLDQALTYGMTTKEIVNVFTTKTQFTSAYPTFLTNEQFAISLVENVVKDSASAAAKAEAIADIAGSLNAGWSRGDVIYQVFQNLANKPLTDVTWGNTAKLFANEVAVAKYYTETLHGNTTDLATLQHVVANVTASSDVSTSAAIDALLAPAAAPEPTFALASSAVSVNEGNTVLFHLDTTHVAPGSVYAYTLTGVSAADVVGGQLTGTVTLDAQGKAVVAVSLVADAVTEGAEHLTLSVAGQTASVVVADTSGTPVSLVESFELTSDASSADEGQTVYFTLDTANVAAGSQYAYTLSGVSASDVVGGSLSGTVTIDASGKAVVAVSLVADAMTEGAETLTLSVAGQTASVVVADTSEAPAPLSRIFVLTSGQDVGAAFTGGALDDTYYATQNTLNSGDVLDGGKGKDILIVTSSSDIDAAPTLTSIETIRVNAPNVVDPFISIDLSNSDGVNTLESYQVSDYYQSGGKVEFLDIQNVNNTNIAIIDTNVDHEFTYDTNAYKSVNGVTQDDIVELSLQEVNGSNISFGNDVPYAPGMSYVDQIDLVSADRLSSPNQASPATSNTLESLRVGDQFDTLNISGDADLEIEAVLDRNIRVIDAETLAADLTLHVDHTDSNDKPALFEYTGAEGKDTFTIERDGNSTIDLETGNDDLTVTGNGNLTITGGLGNDTVSITADQGDSVDDGHHLINLGEGNDKLTIVGDVDDYNTPLVALDGITTIDAGTGDDIISITGTGDYTIELGEGNDQLTKVGAGDHTVNAGSGMDTVTIVGDGNNTVDLGTEADVLDITGNGVKHITAGTGDDTITVTGNGSVIATGDEGADHITITGYGVHNIDLGTGNDYLLIDGARVANDNVDNTIADEMTTIIGGEGNDTVDVRFDHYLNADLGKGNDLLILRAEDLTTEDVVKGDVGKDTLRLTNEDFSTEGVLVDHSETNGTTGIETFDLRQANITLELNADNFDTAEGKAVTVYTRESEVALLDANDYQAVDITAVPLSLNSGRSFTLLGGVIKDIVIADDDSINGRSTLEFDAGGNDSVEDTLRVIGSANITAADLRNVSGLEIIELTTGANSAARWDIQLNDRVINQTTSTAALVIKVDTEVPAGSKLYITLDPSVVNATNDVVIERNSNVSVYINNVLVTESHFGVTDYNLGAQSITVVNPLEFTSNTDNLIGSDFVNDTFTAESLDQIQSGDFADGKAGFDTAEFDFAVANPDASLRDQLENATFESIERFEFNTENVVRMNGIGFGYASDLQELATGSASDELYNMRKGLTYELNAGNDFISLSSLGASWTEVDGGLGSDTVQGSFQGDAIEVSNVEVIDGGAGYDSVDILTTGSQAANGLIALWNVEHITATAGDDNIEADSNGGTIWLDAEGGDDTLNVGANTPSSATVYGGAGADAITVHATAAALVYGDDNNLVTADGNDTISVIVTNGSASVFGEGGSDSITVDASGVNNLVFVDGGTGGDTISAIAAATGSDGTVLGGDGDDTIYLHAFDNSAVDGGQGADNISSDWGNQSTVLGGEGNDTIAVTTFVTGLVDGGSDNDTITVTNDGAATNSTVLGGLGDDSITTSATGNFTITGGAGNDTVHVGVSSVGGQDTLVFGNVHYDALQHVDDNTQGMDIISGFNFEAGVNAPGAEDKLDFSAFLGSTFSSHDYNGILPGAGLANGIHYGDWTGGSTNTVDMDNLFGGTDAQIAVIAADDGFTLTAADISNNAPGTIQIDDNGRAVVIVAQDHDGTLGNTSGYDTFDVYYVQDVDSDTGSAWAVNLVGTITSATDVGAISSINPANFV